MSFQELLCGYRLTSDPATQFIFVYVVSFVGIFANPAIVTSQNEKTTLLGKTKQEYVYVYGPLGSSRANQP